jgi:hypothetical protein
MSATDKTSRTLNRVQWNVPEQAEMHTENIWFLSDYQKKHLNASKLNTPSLRRSSARPGRFFPTKGTSLFLSPNVRLTVTAMTMVSDSTSAIIPPMRTEEG